MIQRLSGCVGDIIEPHPRSLESTRANKNKTMNVLFPNSQPHPRKLLDILLMAHTGKLHATTN